MLLQDEITPEQICRVLYDQEVLKMDQDTYNKLANGSLSAYDFIRDKIENIDHACAAGFGSLFRLCSGDRSKYR